MEEKLLGISPRRYEFSHDWFVGLRRNDLLKDKQISGNIRESKRPVVEPM
jgi:hypothetical protein